jgi:hypothetical protein
MKTAEFKKVASFRLAASAAGFGLICVIGLTPVPAAAQGTPEQQQACTPDVMRLCNQFVPDIPKITVCMNHNWKSVSQACRDALHPPHVGGRTRHTPHHRVPHHASQ